MASLGERLKAKREEAGLSQSALAGPGVSAGYVSLLEQGKRVPSSQAVHYLASRLKCSVSFLMDGTPSDEELRIEVELGFAKLAVQSGESTAARTRIETILHDRGEELPLRIQDDFRWLLGLACDRSGDLPAAIGVFQDLYERVMRRESHLLITMVAVGLCGTYVDAGDLAAAVDVGERALAEAERRNLAGTNDFFRVAATVADAYICLGNLLQARLWVSAFLDRAHAADARAGEVALYWEAAVLADQEGRLTDAVALLERALICGADLESARDTPRLYIEFASLLLETDPAQEQRASALLDEASILLQDMGTRVDWAAWNRLSAKVRLLRKDIRGAETLARRACDQVTDAAPAERASAWMLLADVLWEQNRRSDAQQALATAREHLEQIPRNRAIALIWRELAERMDEWTIPGATDVFRRSLECANVRARGLRKTPPSMVSPRSSSTPD